MTRTLLALVAWLSLHAWSGEAAAGGTWIGTWNASATYAAPALEEQTVRQVVRVSEGGRKVRVRFSNAFGRGDLRIGGAQVALRAGGAAVRPGSERALTFAGAATAIIPAGATWVSDPVDLYVTDRAELVITLYLPGATGPATSHFVAQQTAYAAPGNALSDGAGSAFTPAGTSWLFLAGVDVLPVFGRRAAVVAFGDSLTDGFRSSLDSNSRWPDVLAQRLDASRRDVAVLNAGVSANRLLHDAAPSLLQGGPSGVGRFDRDVLTQAGARYVVVLIGINDIGLTGALGQTAEEVTAEQIIAGYRQLIARAHSQGLKIYGGTLLPFKGTTARPGYYTEAGEAKRQQVNQWIRTSGAFDAVIDFERVVRDPADPQQLRAEFDGGDRLHLNDAGYAALANAIDLRLFDD